MTIGYIPWVDKLENRNFESGLVFPPTIWKKLPTRFDLESRVTCSTLNEMFHDPSLLRPKSC